VALCAHRVRDLDRLIYELACAIGRTSSDQAPSYAVDGIEVRPPSVPDWELPG
jgi:hypothetical protein